MVLCHDLTSSYYEGEGGSLAQFGYSRDDRADRPQITWGMVVTPEGLPITMQVYAGNTTDNTTGVRTRERLTEVFGLKEGIYVGDRGMKSREVLEDLHAHGFHYILAETNRNVEEILDLAKKVKPVAVDHQNIAREVLDREGRRFIVLLNEERRKTELEVLERRIAQGNSIVAEARRGWARRPSRHHHILLKQAQASLAAKGLSGLFERSTGTRTRSRDSWLRSRRGLRAPDERPDGGSSRPIPISPRRRSFGSTRASRWSNKGGGS